VSRLGRLSAAVAVLACALAGPPAPAAAATPEETTRAREHFEKGRVHYELTEYEQALKQFKDAYRLVQDPVFLYNIAQCHWKLGQNKEAVDFYRNYLRRAPNAPNRADLEKRIAELESQPAAPPPRAEPPAPGAERTREPPNTTGPAGAARAGPPRAESPAPAAAPADSPAIDLGAAPPPSEPAPRPAFYKRWWFWTGVGLLAAGAGAAAFALSRRGEIGDCMGLPRCATIAP
jgi:tetratricopeptide (TPR) repeat protein